MRIYIEYRISSYLEFPLLNLHRIVAEQFSTETQEEEILRQHEINNSYGDDGWSDFERKVCTNCFFCSSSKFYGKIMQIFIQNLWVVFEFSVPRVELIFRCIFPLRKQSITVYSRNRNLNWHLNKGNNWVCGTSLLPHAWRISLERGWNAGGRWCTHRNL